MLLLLAAGYAIGAASYLAGIMSSALADLPTGPVTVWTRALISVLAGFAIGARASASIR